MNCCEPLNDTFQSPVMINDTVAVSFKTRVTRLMAYFRDIVTPEPTDPPQPPPQPARNRLVGATKVLFWVAASITIAITLATLCA